MRPALPRPGKSMRYIPHTPEEIAEMLKVAGVGSPEDLFSTIPEEFKLKKPLNLPPPLCEMELKAHLLSLSKKNVSVRDSSSFLGGGAYHHYIPAAISQLINRGEFFTAYTPYQPEVSQGTLQALFEYQTLVCRLTGMEIANASNYDASTACAEAVLMAHRINKRKKALVARSLHPQYRKVMKTYLDRFGFEIVEIGATPDGSLDLGDLDLKNGADVSVVMTASPNFFGVIEDIQKVKNLAKKHGALFATVASEPLSLALLKSPGEVEADIAVLEGQSFGVGLNFGGPNLGIFTSRQKYIRNMPGRIVGETVDTDGKRGYVLTFATREQHIRRERATSNICTNQGLCALMASIYLSLLGKEGLVELAKINLSRADYLKKALLKAGSGRIKLRYNGPTFNEFVISVPEARSLLEKLRSKNIFGGILLDRYYDELKDCVLVCATEMNSKDSMDRFAEETAAFIHDRRTDII